MGDLRYEASYSTVRDASDPLAQIRELSDEGVISALAAASREHDPYIANVLATEAMNRMHRAGTIMRTLGEGVFALDKRGRLTYANRAAEQMVGWREGALIGKDLHETIHRPAADGTAHAHDACPVREAMKTGEIVRRHNDRFTRVDGSRLDVALTVAPIFWGDEIEGAAITFRDVTARRRQEAALERQAAAMNAAMDGMAILDGAWRYVYVNEAHAHLYGYDTPADLLGKSWTILYDEAGRAALEETAFPELRRMGHWRGEAVGLRKDGTRFAQELSLAMVRTNGLVCIVRDISQQKRAECALREGLERFRLLAHATESSVWDWDIATGDVWWNDRFYECFGYQKGSTMATLGGWRSRIHPDDRARIERSLEATLEQSDAAWNEEYRFRRADGTYAHISDRGYVIRDSEGHPTRMVGSMIDVSQRKEAEAELRASEARWRSYLDNSPEIVVIVDRDGRIQFINRVVDGVSRESVLGRPFQDYILPKDQGVARRALAKVLETGEVERYEVRGLGAHRQLRWYRTTMGPLVEDGHVAAVMLVSADITESRNAREALAQSSATYRAVMEAADLAGLGLALAREGAREEDVIVEHINKAGAAILGGKPSDFIGRSGFEHIAARDRTRVLEQSLRRQRGEPSPNTDEITCVRLDGKEVILDVGSSRVQLAGKAMTVSFFRDVTARKRETARQLQIRDAHIRHIVENVSEILTVVAPDGTIRFESPSITPTLGYAPNELIERNFLDFVHTDDVERVQAHLRQANSPVGHGDCIEYRFKHSDGSWRYLDSQSVDLDATPVGGILVSSRDVTHRREAEDALAQRETQLREAERLASMGSWEWDTGHDRLAWSDELYRIFGVEPGAVAPTLQGFLALVHPDDRERVLVDVQRTVEVGREGEYPFRILRPDGEIREIRSRGTPVRDEAGRVIRVIGMAQDVTDQSRAQAEINRLNKDLERRVSELGAANEELESFSYTVSHDLRAPLRGIDFFSEVLSEEYAEKLDGEGRDYLERLRAESNRLTTLINELLTLSRVGRATVSREDVDLSALAGEVVQTLREDDPDREAEVVIESDVHARADPVLIRIVLENLLGNAWKFTRHTPRARIEFGSSNPGAERVFRVSDNGAGFDMAQRDRLFRAFERLHKPGEFEGTGIGLATVERIVRMHGGRVWAEGEVGKGATFYFTVPNGS